MSASFTAIVVIASCITLFTYLFAFVFAITKRRLAPRATKYLLGALGLLAFSWLTSMLVFPLVVRFYSPEAIGWLSVFMQLGNATFFAIALGIIVLAVYIDRPEPQVKDDDFLQGDQEPPNSDANPFVSPRQ